MSLNRWKKTSNHLFVYLLLCHEENKSYCWLLSSLISYYVHSTKSKLTFDEVNQVAETLSTLHALGFRRPVPSSREIVNENRVYIQELLTRRLHHNFDHFLHVLFSHKIVSPY
jgi:hypothetical protein